MFLVTWTGRKLFINVLIGNLKKKRKKILIDVKNHVDFN